MTLCALSPQTIARCVADALHEELVTFPKPGLVSFMDNGSHPDMDADCFLTSIAAITPFFAEMAGAAGENASLSDLQEIGLTAETAMFAATGGRNTHKGAIFCLGLLAAAAGVPEAGPERSLGRIVRERWGRDIPRADALPETSAGIALCRQFHLGGVRAEAAGGFPSVYQYGLPILEAITDREAARVQVFFHLLEHCEDTTVLKRGGLAGRQFACSEARRFLQNGGVKHPQWKETAEDIHREFVRRNLTAGGTADLLAATLFTAKIARLR
ncbi:MAG: triphosphoribosyl-dephospho-CoA synthase [Chthoniobacterales bacterium]|nr:triphosphoribosyl-dephospho-CoA synthase [Chthoniobacterales bacterium]